MRRRRRRRQQRTTVNVDRVLVPNEPYLGLVHLEEHAGDLGRGRRLDRVDQRVQRLAEEHALLVGGGGGQLGGQHGHGVGGAIV